MRDLVAIIVAIGLALFALRMATSLQWYRRSHSQRRRDIECQGQTVVVEIPSDEGFQFFAEDADAFYWSGQRVQKSKIRSTRILISGAPLAAQVARRFAASARDDLANIADDPEAFERDRWDVEIRVEGHTVLVECGAIRERVSQELARQVFKAVKVDIDARDAEQSDSVGELTIPVQ